jgi:hypothetical protein
LRESKPLRGFDFAEFAHHSRGGLGRVWGKAPNSENQNAARFGSPCAGENRPPRRFSPSVFCFAKTQRSVTAGLLPARLRRQTAPAAHTPGKAGLHMPDIPSIFRAPGLRCFFEQQPSTGCRYRASCRFLALILHNIDKIIL